MQSFFRATDLSLLQLAESPFTIIPMKDVATVVFEREDTEQKVFDVRFKYKVRIAQFSFAAVPSS